jgi:ABC-type multidrug transport system fused ATPase/permease subunit
MNALPPVLAGSRRRLFAWLIANGVAQAATLIATAWLVKQVFDGFIAGTRGEPSAQQPLAVFALGLAATAGLIAWLRMRERIDAERLGQDYVHTLRQRLFSHLGRLGPRGLQRYSQGGVLLRFIGDLNALKQWVSLGIARLAVASVTGVGTLAALSLLSWELALAMASVILVGGLLSLVLGAWLERSVRDSRRRRARLAANVNEKVGNFALVAASGQMRRERRRFRRQSAQLKEAMVERARALGGLRAVVEAVAALAAAGILLVGAGLVAGGSTTAGTVVAAMSLVALLVPALRDLSRVHEFLRAARVSREKISEFLNDSGSAPAAAPGKRQRLRRGPGRLGFEDIVLPGVFDGLHAVCEPGQVVALVGPNGAGKSSLLALAAGTARPARGRVVLDGQDLADVKAGSLRRAVALVSPDLALLRGTVGYNLRYRWREAPDEELARVCALCGVDEVLAELPQGLDSRLAEGGRDLSPGQRQRIALARGLLGNPRVLLLDEIDAGLDPATEAAMRRALGEYRGTVLLATHRRDWLSLADEAWHLAGGRLVERGTPEELLNDDGPTARLFTRAPLRVVGT